MPEKAVLLKVGSSSVIFLDPSDPRIPYQTEHRGSSMYQNSHVGYSKQYVSVITPEETAAAKMADKRILKPYNSNDDTDDFAKEHSLPQKTTGSDGFYNEEGFRKTKTKLDKADILRAIYPDWHIEEESNPAWYEEVYDAPIEFIVNVDAEVLKNEALAKIKERTLSNGTSLKKVASEYYDLLIKIREAWWDTYTPLLKTKGSTIALNSARNVAEKIRYNFIPNKRAATKKGGKRNKKQNKKSRSRR